MRPCAASATWPVASWTPMVRPNAGAGQRGSCHCTPRPAHTGQLPAAAPFRNPRKTRACRWGRRARARAGTFLISARPAPLPRPAGLQYGSRNVLADAGIREGIKRFTDWPTIPQVQRRRCGPAGRRRRGLRVCDPLPALAAARPWQTSRSCRRARRPPTPWMAAGVCPRRIYWRLRRSNGDAQQRRDGEARGVARGGREGQVKRARSPQSQVKAPPPHQAGKGDGLPKASCTRPSRPRRLREMGGPRDLPSMQPRCPLQLLAVSAGRIRPTQLCMPMGAVPPPPRPLGGWCVHGASRQPTAAGSCKLSGSVVLTCAPQRRPR
jgi:hypothetical protein